MKIVESLNYIQLNEAQYLHETINQKKAELNDLFAQHRAIDVATLKKSRELDQLIFQYMTLYSNISS